MNSKMVEVTIPVELYINVTQNGEIDPSPSMSDEIPMLVKLWIGNEIVRDFILNKGGRPMLPQSEIRKFTMEVLVSINGNGKAIRADCQTICPGFVGAWVEQEAMKQYNQEHNQCGR